MERVKLLAGGIRKISTWMEENEYHAVNSEKTLFMNRDGKDFIVHEIFVDDMKHVPTAQYLLDEFLEKYSWDFEITGGHHLIESFIGLDFEQSKSRIFLHLDAYIQETLDIYKAQPGTKMLRPKTTLMQQGKVLTSEDVPKVPEEKPTSVLSFASITSSIFNDVGGI